MYDASNEPEAYLEASQISTRVRFYENSYWLVNGYKFFFIFAKKLHRKCFVTVLNTPLIYHTLLE